MKHKYRSGGWLAGLLWFLTTLLSVYTLVVYALSYTVRVEHWVAGFLMLSLPVAMTLLVLAFGYWLLVHPGRAWLPLVVLVLGWAFWQRTLAWHTPPDPTSSENTLNVLTYNLMYFDVDAYTERQQIENAPRMIDWVADFRADVKCFQEFYNWELPGQFEVFHTAARLRRAGCPYAVFLKPLASPRLGEGFLGLAIFSRYPLIRRDTALFSSAGNGYLVADLVRGRDTVRIINVHLHSMSIRVGSVLRQQSIGGAETRTRGIAGQLKRGFEKRAGEIRRVEQVIRASPYPVILCGDLNETPYGLAYGRLRGLLSNAFEDAGRGFGFSYNRPPKFIRIDNQFYSKAATAGKLSLNVRRFTTHSGVKFSDHCPVSAEYLLRSSKK